MRLVFGNPQPADSPLTTANVVRLLARRYFLALAAIIGLIAVDQIAIQPFVSRLGSFAPAINLAGRQRMLSQKLTKSALALMISKGQAATHKQISELDETLKQWSAAHEALRGRRYSQNVHGPRTGEIESEWLVIEPHFQAMRRAATAILRSPDNSGRDQWNDPTAVILEHESAFLASMDRIVMLMENESAVAELRLRIGTGAIAVAIVCLATALGWFVVRPATRTIRCQINNLGRQVEDRTRELSTVVTELRHEVVEREAAELKNHRLAGQLAHAARVSTLGHLTAGLAHELNQPLATIANYAEACDVELRRHPDSVISDRLLRNLEKTKQAALRAGQIVLRIRDFIRPERSARKQLRIDSLIRDVVEFCQAEIAQAESTIALELADERALVLVDSIQIQQVLVNLLQNALDAVRVCPIRDRHIHVRIALSNDLVQVDVVDSGVGFGARDPEAVFAPFYSTKRYGLGIGLSISRSIVEDHGGDIWAENSLVRGAIVSFSLPRVPKSETNVGTSGARSECICS